MVLAQNIGYVAYIHCKQIHQANIVFQKQLCKVNIFVNYTCICCCELSYVSKPLYLEHTFCTRYPTCCHGDLPATHALGEAHGLANRDGQVVGQATGAPSIPPRLLPGRRKRS